MVDTAVHDLLTWLPYLQNVAENSSVIRIHHNLFVLTPGTFLPLLPLVDCVLAVCQ